MDTVWAIPVFSSASEQIINDTICPGLGLTLFIKDSPYPSYSSFAFKNVVWSNSDTGKFAIVYPPTTTIYSVTGLCITNTVQLIPMTKTCTVKGTRKVVIQSPWIPPCDLFNGLDESNLNSFKMLQFSPNPVSDRLNIELGQGTRLQKLTLLNGQGQIVSEIQKPETKLEINFENLPPGLYLLKAEDYVSQKIFKVVKE